MLTPAAPAEVVHRLLGHVRFPRLAKDRQVQLETDELAMQYTALIAKAYREELHGEDTPRTRIRSRLLKFEELIAGMQVQVMDDLAFVKAECAKSAPGANGKICGWKSEMAASIGKEFEVQFTGTKYMGATLATRALMGFDFMFPFTVLTKVRTDTGVRAAPVFR